MCIRDRWCIARLSPGTVALGIHRGNQKPRSLRQAADQVHILNGLSGGSLADIVDHRADDQAVRAVVIGRSHGAQVGAVNPLGLHRLVGGENHDKGFIFVEAVSYTHLDVYKRQARFRPNEEDLRGRA